MTTPRLHPHTAASGLAVLVLVPAMLAPLGWLSTAAAVALLAVLATALVHWVRADSLVARCWVVAARDPREESPVAEAAGRARPASYKPTLAVARRG